MLSSIRRRLTYTNIAMTVALVFALTGGAYAAQKFVITSIKQIKPSVVAQLKGKAGRAGPVGAAGPAGVAGAKGDTGLRGETGAQGLKGEEGQAGQRGATGPSGATGPVGAKGATGPGGTTGATGPDGSPWTVGGLVPAGKTISGNWLVDDHAAGANEAFGNGTSFVLHFASAPTAHWIMEDGEEATTTGEQKSTVCLGSAAAPSASAGQLCIYTDTESGLSTNEVANKFFFQWKWGAGFTASAVGFDVKLLAAEEGSIAAGGTWAATA